MSDDATPRLNLPYLAAGQAQKHVTLNEALALLDGLVQTAAVSRTTDAQPGSPGEGDLYIMTASASGADWSGKAEGEVMRFEAGAWAQVAVDEGHLAWIKDEDAAVAFDGAAWAPLAAEPTELQDLDLVGVNATADATNKLSVASDAVLFSHDGSDAQVKVNKAAAGDTASHLFQTGFSGRAEFGLTGDDDFHVKVSADGSAWHEVMSADRATGRASFALSPQRTQTDVITSSGSYSVPAWAKRLRIVATGAGGGGGGGASGTNAADRQGGGGGGGGGRTEAVFDIDDDLGGAASLTVTIGAPGTGGAGRTGTGGGNTGVRGGDTTVAAAGVGTIYARGGYPGAGGGTGSTAGGKGGEGSIKGNDGATTINYASARGVPYFGQTEGLVCDFLAPGGGAGGGGVRASDNAASTGGIGGRGSHAVFTAPGGAAGSDGSDGPGRGGGGGGSGTSSASANGGDGGDGGDPGGGGGGGAACREAYTSGAGGDGGRGEVLIVAMG